MSNADQIRQNAVWAKTVLGNALAGMPESENNFLPPPESPEDIGRYKELQQSADAIVAAMDEGTVLPHALVLEYGFLHHIVVGWGFGTQNKFLRHQKRSNELRHANADQNALDELSVYRRSRRSLPAKDAIDQLPKCGRRKRERLLKLLKAGRIPD